MEFHKWIYKYIVYTSVFVGLAGAAILYSTSVLLKISTPLAAYVALILGTYAVYNINRSTDKSEDRENQPERYEFFSRNEKVLKTSAYLAYIIALAISIQYGIFALFLTIYFFAIGALYSIKWGKIIKPKAKKARFKDIFLIKNFFVAIAWCVTTAFYPSAFTGTPIPPAGFLLAIFIFIKIFVNTIVIDIRDMQGDARNDIITMPIKFGVKKTKSILLILTILAFLIIYVGVQNGLLDKSANLVNLVNVYTAGYIISLNNKNKDIISDVLADGEVIVMAILAFLSQIF